MMTRTAWDALRDNLSEAERNELRRLACETHTAFDSKDVAEWVRRAAAFDDAVRGFCVAKNIHLSTP
jgi:DNA-binding GntR family transcriptional regulator